MKTQNYSPSFGMSAKSWHLRGQYAKTFEQLEPLLNQTTKGVRTAVFEDGNKLIASSMPETYPSLFKSIIPSLKLLVGLPFNGSRNGYVAIKKDANPSMLKMVMDSAQSCRELWGIKIK